MKMPRRFVAGLVVVLTLAAWQSIVLGQSGVTDHQNALASCVYAVANRQASSMPRAGPDELAEVGLAFCQTEERALLSYMRDAGLTAREAESGLVSTRTRIKNTLRDVFNNPAKYANPRR